MSNLIKVANYLIHKYSSEEEKTYNLILNILSGKINPPKHIKDKLVELFIYSGKINEDKVKDYVFSHKIILTKENKFNEIGEGFMTDYHMEVNE
jgi:hypothetical protein